VLWIIFEVPFFVLTIEYYYITIIFKWIMNYTNSIIGHI